MTKEQAEAKAAALTAAGVPTRVRRSVRLPGGYQTLSEQSACRGRAAVRAWLAAHPDKARAFRAKWVAANQQRQRDMTAAWEAAHPLRAMLRDARRVVKIYQQRVEELK